MNYTVDEVVAIAEYGLQILENKKLTSKQVKDIQSVAQGVLDRGTPVYEVWTTIASPLIVRWMELLYTNENADSLIHNYELIGLDASYCRTHVMEVIVRFLARIEKLNIIQLADVMQEITAMYRDIPFRELQAGIIYKCVSLITVNEMYRSYPELTRTMLDIFAGYSPDEKSSLQQNGPEFLRRYP